MINLNDATRLDIYYLGQSTDSAKPQESFEVWFIFQGEWHAFRCTADMEHNEIGGIVIVYGGDSVDGSMRYISSQWVYDGFVRVDSSGRVVQIRNLGDGETQFVSDEVGNSIVNTRELAGIAWTNPSSRRVYSVTE